MTKKTHTPCEWQTYDQWVGVGRHVMKGQKSVRRDKSGVPLFAREQTDESCGLQRGVKPDHFGEGPEPHGFNDLEEDPYQDNWLFT